jgi:hypothetical protein
MPVSRLPHTKWPSPARDDWCDFLSWLARERDYSGLEIVDVVEKPSKYGDEYALYLSLGGLER